MTEGLPHLHDAHHRCVDLILPVLKHTFGGADLFLYLKGKEFSHFNVLLHPNSSFQILIYIYNMYILYKAM